MLLTSMLLAATEQEQEERRVQLVELAAAACITRWDSVGRQ